MQERVFAFIYWPLMIWLGIVVFIFLWLFFRYSINLKGKDNPFERETFAMPRGVLRGILTLSVLFVVLLVEVANIGLLRSDAVEWTEIGNVTEPLLTAFQMIIAFYFGGKVIDHLAEVDKEKSKNRADTLLGRQSSTSNIASPDSDAVG